MANPDVRDLEKYCTTDKQRCYVAMVRSGYTIAAAAKEIGISERNFSAMLSRLRKIRDAAEIGAPIPGEAEKFLLAGQQVRGISAHLKDQDGNGFWFKTERDKQELEDELEEIRKGFTETLPREKAVAKSNALKSDDLLNVHILTDYHLGMYSWGEESGEDWDMKIAEDLLVKWFLYSIKHAPKAKTGLLAQLGDLLHYDSIEAVTPTSKHLLDADGRFQKMVRVVIRSLRRVIRAMLKKYEQVHLIMADANHDPASSAWLREVFSAFYDDEPRITVDTSPDTYYCHEHGLTSLFFHHGHRRKVTNIDDVLASKFRDVFGRTKHSYVHMGHLHHKHALETNLMLVEQHRTMAAKDAYASSHGYMAGRSAATITYSKEYGEVSRLEVTPDML